MAKETKEERRARIQKEVAAESEARRKAYFEEQAKSKAAAEAIAPALPKSDAYNYQYAWRQDAGGPEGELKLIKTVNPYYDAATNTITDPVTGLTTPATQSMWSGPTTFRGDSSASTAGVKTIVSSVKNADGTTTTTYSDGTTTIFKPTGTSDTLYDAKRIAGYGIDAQGNQYRGSGTTGDPLILNGSPFTGTRNGARYVSGVLQTDNSGNTGGTYTGNGTANNPLLLNGVPFTGILGGINYSNGIAQKSDSPSGSLTAADIETKARRTAQQDFKAALGELGLGDLADEVDRMIRLDYTVSQIKMELPKTSSYQLRFPGMEALRKAGRAISEATYISNERGYLQTLRAYGLDTSVLGSRSELGKYIQNEVSPREFEERVNIAATRVKENPDVTAAFKSFYPEVDESGVIAYLLNPTKGMDIIRKQIRISEIGAASQVAGFAKDIVGVDQAAALISAVGETGYGALRTEFQRARQLAMSQRRLAQIEGQQYTDLEAIGAVVGDDVTKMLASERRAAREVARFGGGGGLTAGSLRETTAI